MVSRIFQATFILIAFAAGLTGYGGIVPSPYMAGEAYAAPKAQHAATADVTIQSAEGEVKARFIVEIAENAEAREIGLMGREYLPENHGMLFLYPEPKHVAMWMKNTSLSLDIFFISQDGEILQIEEKTTPYSLKLMIAEQKVNAVLELNAGTAQQQNLQLGNKVIWARHP